MPEAKKLRLNAFICYIFSQIKKIQKKCQKIYIVNSQQENTNSHVILYSKTSLKCNLK